MYDEISLEQFRLSAVWPEWKITRRIGKGSYGTVYEIVRNDLGNDYKCALKVLHMEADDGDTLLYDLNPLVGGNRSSSDNIKKEQLVNSDDPSPQNDRILEDFINSVSSEINMMMQLKGAPNIVTIEDYHVLRERHSCTIMIRMEMLESLEKYLKRTGSMEWRDVVGLGIDICNALEFCEQNNIIHRDIKPGNIFYSEKAGFKLGDFGISRTISTIHEKLSMSGAGTIQYMAPEVYFARRYNHTIDIYSLGVVLYILLNDNLPPLLSRTELRTDQEKPGISLLHSLNMRRLKGEKLPLPSNADQRLGRVICKACDPVSEKRYQTAVDFRDELKKCLNKEEPVKNPWSRFLPLVLLGIVFAAICIKVVFKGSGSLTDKKPEVNTVSSVVFYTILARDTNGDTIERIVKEGNIGDQVTEAAPEIEGYVTENEEQTLVLTDNASNNIILFLYEKKAADNSPSVVIYTVVSVDSANSEILSENRFYGERGRETILRAPALEGYVPQTGEQTVILSDNEAENTFYIVYDSYETIAEKLDIPDGKILQYNEHTYYAMCTDTIDSFWDANRYCADRGGHLAVIDDAAENAALYDYVFYDLKYESAYFGLTDDGSEDDWYWVDGSAYEYNSWLSGQPDDQNGAEKYALFYYKDTPYKWNDGDFGKDANGKVIFLIEWDK